MINSTLKTDSAQRVPRTGTGIDQQCLISKGLFWKLLSQTGTRFSGEAGTRKNHIYHFSLFFATAGF